MVRGLLGEVNEDHGRLGEVKGLGKLWEVKGIMDVWEVNVG